MGLFSALSDECVLEAVGLSDECYLLKRPVCVNRNHPRHPGFMIRVIIKVWLIAVGEGGVVKTVIFPTYIVEQMDPVFAV
jgi:hypothetical protein